MKMLAPRAMGFALASSALLTCCVMRVQMVGLDRVAEWQAGACFDACVFAWLWLGGAAIARRSGGRLHALMGLYYPVIVLFAALVFAHSYFFDAAIERRLTVFDMSWRGPYEFVAHVLPESGRVIALAYWIGFHLLVLLIAALVHTHLPELQAAWFVVSVATIACALDVASVPRVTSPLWDTAAELRMLIVAPKVKVAKTAPAPSLLNALDHSAHLVVPNQARFDKVIVLVMETMTASKFADEAARLPAHTFVHDGREHSHRYTRYFPDNQDSRTGMLDMLSARLIPYEAYNDDDVARYRALGDRRSLVDAFRAAGFASSFASSQLELEDVVGELSWDETLLLNAKEIAAAQKKALCFVPDVYEQSCEDLVILPKIMSFLSEHPRAFVYQEFIWGHAWEYNEASHKTNTQYYSAYVDALIAALREAGMLEHTLIALTSDHGFRDKSLQTERWVYEIPLLFYASDFKARLDARLFSHVDFAELLFHELAPQTSDQVAESPVVMIVGPTESGMVTTFTPEDEMITLRKFGPFSLELARVPPVGGRALGASRARTLFEAYRREFDLETGRPSP